MVEHPFGSIKQWMNQGAFLMKGLDNVRAEFNLTARASEGLGRGGRGSGMAGLAALRQAADGLAKAFVPGATGPFDGNREVQPFWTMPLLPASGIKPEPTLSRVNQEPGKPPSP